MVVVLAPLRHIATIFFNCALPIFLPLAPLNVSSPPSNNAWIAVVSCSEYFNANRFFLPIVTPCQGQDQVFE